MTTGAAETSALAYPGDVTAITKWSYRPRLSRARHFRRAAIAALDSMLRFGGLNHGSAAGLTIAVAKLLGRYPPKSGLVMLIVILPVVSPLRHSVNRLQKGAAQARSKLFIRIG
jgi:hypothetical protein